MDNPETLATPDTQDTRRRHTQRKKSHTAQKATTINNTNLSKNWGWTKVIAEGKQYLSVISHPPGNSYSQDVFDTTMCNKHKSHKLDMNPPTHN
jgi:hypothetical protein